MAKQKIVYMVGDTGAVRLQNPERFIVQLFQREGYRVSTREEWREKRRWQARQDAKEAKGA